MRTLTRIFARNLLGEFTHEVRFPAENEFVVIIGPNGVGKTRLLELVHATFRSNFQVIANTEFDELIFEFNDGARLEIKKGLPELDGNDAEIHADLTVTKAKLRAYFLLNIFRIGEEDVSWRATSLSAEDLKNISLHELDYYMTFANRKDISSSADGPVNANFPTLGSKFEWNLHNRLLNDAKAVPPEEVAVFLSSVTVHLIETQRLVIFRSEHDSKSDRERRRTNTVEEFAFHLKHQIADVLAQNSRTSQQLDRSFPRRVLATSPLEYDATDEIIRERYRSQSAFRDALEDIGVLDMQEDVPISEDSLDDWQRRVLSVYLDDTDQKLSTFQWLLDRINLLRNIVNERFLGKSLKVDRETGFRFELKQNNRRLDPSQLSSGEQHEIVLLYDLLFNVTEGSLVLIDEPEISLNVAWQRQFLADIQRIARLANLRFIIATHSPQIIHKWSERVSPLGSLKADEKERKGQAVE